MVVVEGLFLLVVVGGLINVGNGGVGVGFGMSFEEVDL